MRTVLTGMLWWYHHAHAQGGRPHSWSKLMPKTNIWSSPYLARCLATHSNALWMPPFLCKKTFWNPAGCTTYFTSKCQSEYFGAEAMKPGLAVRGNTIHANHRTAHRMAQQRIVIGETATSPVTGIRLLLGHA